MGRPLKTPPERIRDRRVRQEEREDAHKLTALGGIAALSLDALSSVAYGPGGDRPGTEFDGGDQAAPGLCPRA
jgi:hypothetical protein